MSFIPRTYTVPAQLENSIAKILKNNFQLDLEDSEHIAKCVERLSEHYIRLPGTQTPWQEDWCQVAYLAYYLPLNQIRARAVIAEARSLKFFYGLHEVQDFGSGLGSVTYDLHEIKKQIHIEESTQAQKLHQQLLNADSASITEKDPSKWIKQIIDVKENSLLSMSYSLAELDALPHWATEFDALMIIEPSTKEQTRKLMRIRTQLIEEGYSIWAPCTHQEACPLLEQSKHDWCHDRVHFEQPLWFSNIEQNLPMKNKTLTFSYLLASRRPTPHYRHQSQVARTVGDMLPEKGKTRQLVCRGQDREFLTWMHRSTKPQEIPRGVLIQWPEEFTLKSNEVRVNSPVFPYENE